MAQSWNRMQPVLSVITNGDGALTLLGLQDMSILKAPLQGSGGEHFNVTGPFTNVSHCMQRDSELVIITLSAIKYMHGRSSGDDGRCQSYKNKKPRAGFDPCRSAVDSYTTQCVVGVSRQPFVVFWT
ncbi:hypothetical protein J6590_071477 [Homalodisca vitripennis]|nr:hypothetical protein J6590_071477 [Homalodisca vitripennis]